MRRTRPNWTSSVLADATEPAGNSTLRQPGLASPEQGNQHRVAPRRLRALRISRNRLEKEIERNPNNSISHQNLGFVLFEQGEISQCIPCLEKAAQLGLYSSRLLSTLGRAFFLQGRNPQRAVQCLLSASQVKQDCTRRKGIDVDHWAFLAHALAETRQPEKSVEVLSRYLLPSAPRKRSRFLKNPQTQLEKLRYLKETGKQLSSIGEKEEVDPRKNLTTCFGGAGILFVFCASQLLRAGKVDEALVQYQRAQRQASQLLHPITHEEVWLLISRAYEKIGQINMAQSACIHSTVDYGSCNIWLRLAQKLLSVHDEFGAMDALEQAYYRNPLSREAQFDLLRLYHKYGALKDREELLVDFEPSCLENVGIHQGNISGAVHQPSSLSENSSAKIKVLQEKIKLQRAKIHILQNEIQTCLLQVNSLKHGKVLVSSSAELCISQTVPGSPIEAVSDIGQLDSAMGELCGQLQYLEHQRKDENNVLEHLEHELQHETARHQHHVICTPTGWPADKGSKQPSNVRFQEGEHEFPSQDLERIQEATSNVLSPLEAAVLHHAVGGDLIEVIRCIHQDPLLLQTVKDSCASVGMQFQALDAQSFPQCNELKITETGACSPAWGHRTPTRAAKVIQSSSLVQEAYKDLMKRWQRLKSGRSVQASLANPLHYEGNIKKKSKHQKRGTTKWRIKHKKYYRKRAFERSHKRSGLYLMENIYQEVNNDVRKCEEEEVASGIDGDYNVITSEGTERTPLPEEPTRSEVEQQRLSRSEVVKLPKQNLSKHQRSDIVTGKAEEKGNVASHSTNTKTPHSAQNTSSPENELNAELDDDIEPELDIEESPWSKEQTDDANLKNATVASPKMRKTKSESKYETEDETPRLTRSRSFKNRKIRKTFHAAQLLLQSFSSEIDILNPSNGGKQGSGDSHSSSSSDEESVHSQRSGVSLLGSPANETGSKKLEKAKNGINGSTQDSNSEIEEIVEPTSPKGDSEYDDETFESEGSIQEEDPQQDDKKSNTLTVQEDLNNIENPSAGQHSETIRQERASSHGPILKPNPRGLKTLKDLGVSSQKKEAYRSGKRGSRVRRHSPKVRLDRTSTMSVLEEMHNEEEELDRKGSTKSAPEDLAGRKHSNIQLGVGNILEGSRKAADAKDKGIDLGRAKHSQPRSTTTTKRKSDSFHISRPPTSEFSNKNQSTNELSESGSENILSGEPEEQNSHKASPTDEVHTHSTKNETKNSDENVFEKDTDGEKASEKEPVEPRPTQYEILGQPLPIKLEDLHNDNSRQIVLESSRKLLEYDDDDDDLFLNVNSTVDMSWPEEFEID